MADILKKCKSMAWNSDTRIGRSRYWALSLGSFAAVATLGALIFLAFGENDFTLAVALTLFLVYGVFRAILIRFRLNDISPEAIGKLERAGLGGVVGRLMIDFAPSHPGATSPQEKSGPARNWLNRVQPFLVNISILVALFAIILFVLFASR